MHGTYIGNGRILVQTTWGAKLIAASSDLSLTPDLVTAGTYDVPFTAFVRRELHAGMTAVDVGANIGLFTLLMAWQVGPGGQVFSFEPEPENLALLRENVAMNYFAGWVDVDGRAVSAQRGEAELFSTSRFRGNSSLTAHDAEYERMTAGLDDIRSTTVQTVALDDVLPRERHVDLVKIDVEGAESQVLAGMRGLLQAGRVGRISVEVSRGRSGSDWDALLVELRGLRDAGWRFATIDAAGDAQLLGFDRLVEVGQFSQVLVER